jgi:ligand-binding SRPBCC domain-containing protein
LFKELAIPLDILYLYAKQPMKIYTIHKKQKLPISIEKAWNFIAYPKNLAVITPPQMRFRTLSGDDRKMFPGQIIHYTVTPLLGIRMQWVTEITHVDPGKYFTDEQRHGPYAFWHHKHFLSEIPGGVEMEDIVHYRLPFGILGQIMHPIIVKPQLDKIFEFRKQKLIELFGEYKPGQR